MAGEEYRRSLLRDAERVLEKCGKTSAGALTFQEFMSMVVISSKTSPSTPLPPLPDVFLLSALAFSSTLFSLYLSLSPSPPLFPPSSPCRSSSISTKDPPPCSLSRAQSQQRSSTAAVQRCCMFLCVDTCVNWGDMPSLPGETPTSDHEDARRVPSSWIM